MIRPILTLIACLAATTLQAAPPPDRDALDFLAKASAAFERNRAAEGRWNWQETERRQLADKSGAILQDFPSVTAESVIQSNGERCNAVTTWGDGLSPYKLRADSDERCRAMDEFRAPFDTGELLKGSQVRVLEWWEKGVALSISPDKARQKSDDPAVRCAASIKAVVRLDQTTFFPISVEGEVVDGGCDVRATPTVQYSHSALSPMRASFRKGASFRMSFVLQKDRFDGANNFWICASQHYLMPWDSENTALVYWGRQVPVTARGRQLVKDIEMKAQQFGATSQLGFE